VEEMPFEVVERKGIGHPDTLCDAIAEHASRYYSLYFAETYGRFAHHWFDKVMLLGGSSLMSYGSGELVSPYRVIYAGKAVIRVGEDRVPLEQILTRAATDVLTKCLSGFDPARHLKVELRLSDACGPVNSITRYTPASAEDLVNMTTRDSVSNDCNVCSAFAPLSSVEQLVLEAERLLTSTAYREKHRAIGTDIKIVGTRHDTALTLVANVPFLANEVRSYRHYLDLVDDVRVEILQLCQKGYEHESSVVVNPQNVNGKPYLTVTGSVADTGDVGAVGRGNRLNGLITPMRPMSIEAPSGKNPVEHTGKLYGVVSQRIASGIHGRFGFGNQVHMITFKERPVCDPRDLVVYLHSNGFLPEKDLADYVLNEVQSIYTVTESLMQHMVTLW
jgi:S-adenosylmethionine synthetase